MGAEERAGAGDADAGYGALRRGRVANVLAGDAEAAGAGWFGAGLEAEESADQNGAKLRGMDAGVERGFHLKGRHRTSGPFAIGQASSGRAQLDRPLRGAGRSCGVNNETGLSGRGAGGVQLDRLLGSYWELENWRERGMLTRVTAH